MIHPRYTMSCELCAQRFMGRIGDTRDDLRREARQAGWLTRRVRVGSTHSLDYCPLCADAIRRAEEASFQAAAP